MNTTRKNRTDQRRQVWSSHLKSIYFFRWFDYIFRKNICYYGYLYINREYTHKFVPHNRTNIRNSTVLYYATLTHLYIVYKQRANVVFFAEVSIQLNEPLYTLLYSIELNWTVLIVICIASYIISLVVLFSRVIFIFFRSVWLGLHDINALEKNNFWKFYRALSSIIIILDYHHFLFLFFLGFTYIGRLWSSLFNLIAACSIDIATCPSIDWLFDFRALIRFLSDEVCTDFSKFQLNSKKPNGFFPHVNPMWPLI